MSKSNKECKYKNYMHYFELISIFKVSYLVPRYAILVFLLTGSLRYIKLQVCQTPKSSNSILWVLGWRYSCCEFLPLFFVTTYNIENYTFIQTNLSIGRFMTNLKLFKSKGYEENFKNITSLKNY